MRRLGGSARAFSPDGTWLVYAVANPGATRPKGNENYFFLSTGVLRANLGSEICVVNVGTHEVRNLTGGKGSNWFPAWSPDGRYLAFLSDRDDSGQAKLWVWDLVTDRIRKVSELAMRMPGPQQIEWTPDSQGVLVTTVPVGLSVADYLKSLESRTAEVPPPGGSTVLVHRSQMNGRNEQHPVTSDPLGSRVLMHDLVLLQIASGTPTTLVHDKKVAAYHLSGDGTKVAYSSADRFERLGSQQRLYDLHVLALSPVQDRVVASSVRLDLVGNFSLSPDSSELVFRASGDEEGTFDIYAVGVYDGRLRNITHFAAAPFDEQTTWKHRWYFSSTILWNAAGTQIYFVTDGNLWRASIRGETAAELVHIPGRRIRQIIAQPGEVLSVTQGGKFTVVVARDDAEKQDGFYNVDLTTGAAVKLLERGECYTCSAGPRGHLVAMTKDGRMIAYTAESSEHPPDIWLSGASMAQPSRLTHLNPEIEKYKMGSGRLVDWLDDDGERLHGALLLPSNYEDDRRYPLVVLVYGGELGSDDLNNFGGFDYSILYLNMQLLATRGYAVLMPDAPQHMGTPMLDLAKTVLPGVNKVVEMGIADTERIGVMGHSYGGYSALSLLVQTRRFKAAMEADGMANLVGFYGEMTEDGTAFGTSSETGQELVGGSPWDHRERYIENSPLFFLDRVETPLLIVHGTEDTAIASFLGDEMFVALRRLGKTVEYAKYAGEDHVFVSFENQMDVGRRMIAWFDKYLKAQLQESPPLDARRFQPSK